MGNPARIGVNENKTQVNITKPSKLSMINRCSPRQKRGTDLPSPILTRTRKPIHHDRTAKSLTQDGNPSLQVRDKDIMLAHRVVR